MRSIDNSVLLTELLEAIADGSMDQHRERIYEAFRRRSSLQSLVKTATFQEGDKVVFNSQVRPTYLNVRCEACGQEWPRDPALEVKCS